MPVKAAEPVTPAATDAAAMQRNPRGRPAATAFDLLHPLRGVTVSPPPEAPANYLSATLRREAIGSFNNAFNRSFFTCVGLMVAPVSHLDLLQGYGVGRRRLAHLRFQLR